MEQLSKIQQQVKLPAVIYSTSYTIEYTTPDCTTTGEFTFTTLDGDDSSFEMTPTCDGAVVTTLATPGGTFAFADPQPTDGAVIRFNNR